MNVKRDIVDRNIKAASSDKDGADFKELTYELYGHGGVGFVINALSDNSNRAYTDVGTVAKKANLKLAGERVLLHNFEKKGRLAVNSALDEDDLIELALENDVDDVEAGEPDPEGMRSDGEDVKTVAWVAPTDLGAMQKALVDAGHDCTANLVHEPMMLVECGDEDLEKTEGRGLDEEVDDVDTVGALAWPSHVWAIAIRIFSRCGEMIPSGPSATPAACRRPSETEPRGDDAPSSPEPPRAGTACAAARSVSEPDDDTPTKGGAGAPASPRPTRTKSARPRRRRAGPSRLHYPRRAAAARPRRGARHEALDEQLELAQVLVAPGSGLGAARAPRREGRAFYRRRQPRL